jgi:hypothetical protein
MTRSGDVAALVWVLFTYRGVDQAKPAGSPPTTGALRKHKLEIKSSGKRDTPLAACTPQVGHGWFEIKVKEIHVEFDCRMAGTRE